MLADHDHDHQRGFAPRLRSVGANGSCDLGPRAAALDCLSTIPLHSDMPPAPRRAVRSMTGFGAGSATVGAERISVEVRSVNHKFCEVKARLPRELGALEGGLVKQVKDRLARGVVDVSVHRARAVGSSALPKVDLELAKEYLAAYQLLGEVLGVEEPASLRAIFEADGVVRLEEASVELEAAGQALTAALAEALGTLTAMREQEGQALARDLEQRVQRIQQLSAEVRRLSPTVLVEYRDRLAARAGELAKGQISRGAVGAGDRAGGGAHGCRRGADAVGQPSGTTAADARAGGRGGAAHGFSRSRKCTARSTRSAARRRARRSRRWWWSSRRRPSGFASRFRMWSEQ